MLFPSPPRSAGRRGPLSPRPAPSPSPHPTPLLALALLALPAAGAARGGFFPATSPHIRLVGRWAHGSGNGTVYADWSSSAIEFTAVGPVSIRIAEGFVHGNEYAVVINGTQAFQLNTNSSKNTYPGSLPDKEGNGGGGPMTFFDHVVLKAGVTAAVRVEKVTESRTDCGGIMAFAGVTAKALLPPAAPPSRRIECIGDSIMCGNHAKKGAPFPDTCPSDRGTDLTSGLMARESSRLSWCPVLARSLNADYQVECCSGDGLIMTDGDTCQSVGGPEICLPALQPHRLMCDAERGSPLPRYCPGLGGDAPLTAADGAPDVSAAAACVFSLISKGCCSGCRHQPRPE